MQRRLLLDVVVRKRAPVLQLLAREDQPLLVGRDALLVLDLALHHVDRVRRLHFQRNRLPGQRLHKNLHARQLLNIKHTHATSRHFLLGLL